MKVALKHHVFRFGHPGYKTERDATSKSYYGLCKNQAFTFFLMLTDDKWKARTFARIKLG